MKKYIIPGLALTILSIMVNIAQFAYRPSNMPYIAAPLLAYSSAIWLDGSDDLTFGGIPVSLKDKKSNLTHGYQYFLGKIRREYPSFNFVCQMTNTLVTDSLVSLDEPFQTTDRRCEILLYNRDTKSAIVKSNGILFNINGEHTTWQDKSGSGPMIDTVEYIDNYNKYH